MTWFTSGSIPDISNEVWVTRSGLYIQGAFLRQPGSFPLKSSQVGRVRQQSHRGLRRGLLPKSRRPDESGHWLSCIGSGHWRMPSDSAERTRSVQTRHVRSLDCATPLLGYSISGAVFVFIESHPPSSSRQVKRSAG